MEETTDINRELMLDANAAAGLLYEIFGIEMTTALGECFSCGNQAELGSLLAFTHGPGVVLRCSMCEHVVVRVVKTPDEIFFDARGAVFIRLQRHEK